MTDYITSDYITAVSADPYDSVIWFTSDHGILQYYPSTKTYKLYDSVYYGNGIRIRAILPEENYVWFATNKGALRFHREDLVFSLYNRKRGLISDNVLSLAADGDYIWFGTDYGATRFFWNFPGRIDY